MPSHGYPRPKWAAVARGGDAGRRFRWGCDQALGRWGAGSSSYGGLAPWSRLREPAIRFLYDVAQPIKEKSKRWLVRSTVLRVWIIAPSRGENQPTPNMGYDQTPSAWLRPHFR
jgi:hypothetical protein